MCFIKELAILQVFNEKSILFLIQLMGDKRVLAIERNLIAQFYPRPTPGAIPLSYPS